MYIQCMYISTQYVQGLTCMILTKNSTVTRAVAQVKKESGLGFKVCSANKQQILELQSPVLLNIVQLSQNF
jgi:hypothetical protein